MIDFNFSYKCYSCMACEFMCPVNAISFSNNLLPIVDETLCINCGKCEKNCIALEKTENSEEIPKDWEGYTFKSYSDEIRKNSSSGGLFYSVAKSFIENGGYVSGCVYDDNWMPKHIVTNSLDLIKKMMGSKYVKSDLNMVYKQIQSLIQSGNSVLFTGTPCQVNSIKKVFNNHQLLTCISVVCHGSIERDVWKAYLDKEQEKGSIVNITMRDKSRGWSNYGLTFTFDNGKKDSSFRNEDGYFLKCYTDGVLERDRCLNCKIKGKSILSDIIMGDGWGIEKMFPDISDELGISAVICLNSKGKELLDSVKSDNFVQKINAKEIVSSNSRIMTPAELDTRMKKFREDFRNNPNDIQINCEKIVKKNRSLVHKMKHMAEKIIKIR